MQTMTGCTLIGIIAKLNFIPKGVLDTPLDRVRGCIRREMITTLKPKLNDVGKWNLIHAMLNKVVVHPLTPIK